MCVNPGKSRGPRLAGSALLFPALREINAAELNDAQKAAYVWLVTAAFWDRLSKQIDPERLLPLDGDEVSENPGAALSKVASFFGLALEEERLEQILADPVLSHHAKFPGQSYDAAKRRSDRADWEARFGAEADCAMAWAAPIQERMESGGVDFSMMASAGCKELVA